ncbi:DUF2064 domain-containing protein [Rhodococcus sp. BP-349]|uniref:TIGR04282 family arsenosugar biosynthesis glycosyltransferase n=1 Tax=unclassified Rhodococcus (in: high G+C Gram-positive bacteria) TaxID=192944 RepID=UPI001C9ABC02|nr:MULTISPECIES: DUF2064 domain-containing protein [unclassified Rhodococcus (in: high G+C Gram-positive bacteria)]MBY6537904.1 DUF2064 domain-containing protein [Rhodococcus sp. BP-363]MBY6542241.1 DUF2064 domain-containing protein [Rhodococcus sp. BP-369]MBY6561471.1 DUF2064 domain-containing protein [Rhodococcus sp. BP-370]MBY6575763.1 DUF2064 domain-containing protein [Rhodococcus sp. BP-364]MBY6585064.1 DUF2064 domain-containing protein [Rhodococcus sp. BP-358]
MIDATLLVIAKAPVPGFAKTRLMAAMSAEDAASVAAAALLDTLHAALQAPFARRVVAMTGDLGEAMRSDEIRTLLAGFRVIDQRGDDFAQRLIHAHHDAAGSGPVVQIGMDTPQVDPAVLVEIGAALAPSSAILGRAEDGGWWVLGLHDASGAQALRAVEMSTNRTGDDTRDVLQRSGLVVDAAPTLRDADELVDLAPIARQCRPDSEFARCVAALPVPRPPGETL